MNILIIEDDKCFGESISDIFAGKAITNRINLIHSFSEFVSKYSTIELYDIVLTDINLGNYREPEGFQVIKSIRECHKKIPIIVISGYDDIDKLRYAFSLGINDYIIKPIRMKELEVRVINWLNIHYTSSIHLPAGNMYTYKEIMYDINQNKFYFKNQYIPLSKNNKYILSLLFSQPEKVLSEKYLGEKIWGDTYYTGKRNIRINILRLKRKLAPFHLDHWIRNIRAEGYILTSEDYCSIYQNP